MMTQHLLELDHRTIGFVAGPKASYSGRKRLQGYKKALADAELEPELDWVQYCLPTTIDGEQAAHMLLNDNPQLSALFCYNDLVALGALRACAASNRRVPADIAVTGFDDIMLAGVVSPALTTCHVPRFEIGRQAVSMLIGCIDDDTDSCDEIVIKPELVVRESTALTERAIYQ